MNRKELFIISLTVFFTVIAWVVSDIFHAQARERSKFDTTVPSTEQSSIDQNVFTILESRVE